MENHPFSKINHLKTIKIDYHNARTIKLQAEQIIRQQVRIDKLREQTGELLQLDDNKSTVRILSIVIAVLVATIAFIVIYFLRQKNKDGRVRLRKEASP